MNNSSPLSSAKSILKEKRFQEAIAIFERITRDKSGDSAEAAYCLGILYQSGSGVSTSVKQAIKYYLMAEQLGYPMATYRLGGVYFSLGELREAYESFRSVAQSNPSAAYWAYRVLKIDGKLDDDPDAGKKHLNSAAEQGHVVAERAKAVSYILGKEGLLKIPYGLALYAKVACNIVRTVVIKDEKVKYE